MKSKYFILGLLVLIVGVSACTPSNTQTSRDTNLNNEQEKSDSSSSNVLAGSTTKYIEFEQAEFEQSLSEKKVVILNFYANWCPTCKAEQKDILNAFDELELDNVVGYRVNYRDSQTDEFETSLARDNGVSYQHTKLIYINGQFVEKVPALSWSKEDWKNELTSRSNG